MAGKIFWRARRAETFNVTGRSVHRPPGVADTLANEIGLRRRGDAERQISFPAGKVETAVGGEDLDDQPRVLRLQPRHPANDEAAECFRHREADDTFDPPVTRNHPLFEGL